MKRFKLTLAADEDLSEIVSYVARRSPQNALKVLTDIHKAARKLAQMPGMGHSREDITDKPVKFWSVHSWLIVYRPDTRPLEIVRIIDGRRDLQRRLRF